MNRPNEAEPLFRHALKIFEASLGPGHPYSAGVRTHLAALEAVLGKGTRPARRVIVIARSIATRRSRVAAAALHPLGRFACARDDGAGGPTG